MIEFSTNESQLVVNPLWSNERQEIAKDLFESRETLGAPADSCLVFSTSGTSVKSEADVKLVLAKKRSILLAAKEVNGYLNAGEKDIWLLNLPPFHIAGISILARAFLSGAKVVENWSSHKKWDASNFIEELQTHQITHVSLVPTQIFDIVDASLTAPSGVKKVLVGGSFLSPQLEVKARSLGWPIQTCFGGSETSAFFAAGEPYKSVDSAFTFQEGKINSESPPRRLFKPLKHFEVSVDTEDRLCLKSEALFEGYLVSLNSENSFLKREDATWGSDDRAELTDNGFYHLGRIDEVIKINGFQVDFSKCRADFARWAESEISKNTDCELIFVSDERSGNRLALVTDAKSKGQMDKIKKLVEKFNSTRPSFERVTTICKEETLPRSPLGKLLKFKLTLKKE